MMTYLRKRPIILLLLITLTTALRAQSNPDSTWPMFCHDLAHTGLSPVTGHMDTCYLYWSYETNGQIFSSPTIGDIDGNGDIEVVVGSDEVNIYAFNGEDGTVLWTYPVGSNEYSSAAFGDVDNNGDIEVIIGSLDDNVYALNGNDGSVLWQYSTGDNVRGSPAIYDIDDDGTPEVVIGSWDHNVYALNGEDGSLLWSYPTGNGVRSSPAIADIDGDSLPEIVIGSWDHNIYALNGENGSLLWSYTTGDGVRSSPSIGDIDADGNLEIIIGSEDNNVYALNGEDGSFFWSYSTSNNVRATPALGDIDEDDSLEVIVGSLDQKVYALNGENGSLLWSYTTNFGIWSSSAIGDVDGDGSLEVVVGSGTSDNSVYALNGEDGAYLWSYTTGDGIAASPALGDVDGDGDLEVIIGSEDNSIYVLRDEPIPPTPFNLISPPDSTILSIPRPTFIWESSFDSLSGLSEYRIYINDTLRNISIDTVWTADYDLFEGNNTWHVVAMDSAGNARQSNQVWAIFIDTSGPYIESTTVWVDTNYTGPFAVATKITDIVGVDSVILYYKRQEDFSWCSDIMTTSSGDWYDGEIPEVSLPQDTVKYYVYAKDDLGNDSSDPLGAPSIYYSFLVYSTGVEYYTHDPELLQFYPIGNPVRDKIMFDITLPDLGAAVLAIYDVGGRLVSELPLTDETKRGLQRISWTSDSNSGIYFCALRLSSQVLVKKMVLLR